MDFQGKLGDLPWNAWHIRGLPHKDVFIAVGEVDERAFLFGGKRGTNAHHFAHRAAGVYEDLLGALYRLKKTWLTAWGRALLRRPPP